MSDGDTGWSPARPAGAGRSGLDRDGLDRDGLDQDGLHRPATAPSSVPRDRALLPAQPGRLQPARRRRRPWSTPRRLLAGYVALLLAITVVVGAGTALQPRYGSNAPEGGVSVADLRSAPRLGGWSVKLARLLGPGLPGSCLQLRSDTLSARRVIVTAIVPGASAEGGNVRCEAKASRVAGRMVAVDPETGRVVWTRSLGDDLDERVDSLVWQPADSVDGLVVGVGGSSGARFLTLRGDTGRTVDQAPVDDPDDAIDFAVSGHLILSAVPDLGGSLETYTLRSTRDLGRTLWSQQESIATLPQLLPDRLLVPLSTGTIQVSGDDGRVSAWATDLRGLQGVRTVGSGIIGVTVPAGVGLGSFVVRLDARGRTVWEIPALAVSDLQVTRSCIAMSSLTLKLTCLDPLTGRSRWSRDYRGVVAGTPTGSRASGFDVIGTVTPGDSILRVSGIDGDTGATRFTADIPRGAEVVAQSLGTGYALNAEAPGGGSQLTGFDVSSGRRLWTITRPSIERWGGRFVSIAGDGTARELVAGRSAGGHAMLVG
jgi:outer membrane protein assembly factor BamB